jgi:CrcB protein
LLDPSIVRYGGLPGKESGHCAVSRGRELFLPLLGIFLAGGLGAALRVGLVTLLDAVTGARVPFVGTLSVNLVGCFCIGFAATTLGQGPWRAIVLGGLLGGFTTYSAFALFTVEAAQNGRMGALAFQLVAHLMGGAACVILGTALARAIVPPGA